MSEFTNPTPEELGQLAELAEQDAWRSRWSCTPTWEPPLPQEGRRSVNGEAEALLPLANLDAWETSAPTAKAFVWQGRIPKGEVTIIVGKGGTTKTTAAQQMVICRAASKPFLGINLEPGPSLFVTAEDDFDQLHWVHDHICRAQSVSRSDIGNRLHLSSVRGQVNNELATFDADGRIRPTEAFARLRGTLGATGADFLVLDNVAHMFAGNENDRGQVTAFVNLLYSLGVTVLLIAHPNKAGDSWSGSTAWLNAIRSQLIVERPEDGLDPDARVLSVGKANYARTGEAITYRWHDFALWLDDELPQDTRAELDEVIRTNGENAAFLACLRERALQGDGRAVGPSPGPNYAPAQFEGMAQAKGFKKATLKRAMDRLFTIGSIESVPVENKKSGRSAHIIREAAQPSHNAPHNARTSLSHNAHNYGAQPGTTHTVDTTYQEGAAGAAGAPSEWEADNA